MPLLSLLFDPRGAIDRRTFWSGLLQLTVVSLAIWLGLARLDVKTEVALAAIPVIGEAFLLSSAVGQVSGALAADIPLVSAILIVAARLYAAACLVLKRSRHAGQGRTPLIAFGLVIVLVHGLMGLWAYDLFDEGMALVVPLLADMAASALAWAILLGWIGALGAGAAKPLAPRMAVGFDQAPG